jgi:MFS family permease
MESQAKPVSAADIGMTEAELEQRRSEIGGSYAKYVLGVLVIVYMFNFIDRQILSILAEDIKRDLKIDDSQLGFLYGTAFAIFYALFGIPLGRLADNWSRTRLMAIGLALWSGMTALSGFAGSFFQLSAARVGVGIGEATLNPSAYSILSDYFPRARRATALAIYSSGLYMGGGVSLLLGAIVVKWWDKNFPDGGALGLAGWQAAFLAVGLPGILMAFWVLTLREPVRGLADGVLSPPPTNIWGKFWDELTSIIPPFTIIHAARYGRRALMVNIMGLGAVAAGVFVLVKLTGDIPQWVAMGIGAYAVFSWAQSLRMRDPAAYKLIWGTPTFIFALVGFGCISFVGYALGYWTAPYVIRTFIEPMKDVPNLPWYATKEGASFILGGTAAATGFIGVISGGILADHFRKTNPAGRVLVGFMAALLPAALVIWMFSTDSLLTLLLVHIPVGILGSMWVGVGATTAQDLVLPRMRGGASAAYLIGTTLIGLGLGPYVAGKVSKVTGSLGTGCMSLLFIIPITVTCLLYVYRNLPKAEASKLERAASAGGLQ